jgi:SAM-dependent methyltransferase
MRWVAKAALQRGLSSLPGGDRLNYALQRTVTRQFPRSDESFLLHAGETRNHFEAYLTHHPAPAPATARFYEFGAGWELITPFLFYMLGVNDQTLVDIQSGLRLRETNHTIAQCVELKAELERRWGRELRAIDGGEVESIAALEDRFGIRYLAPHDARDTEFAPGSFDFASNTFTMEHIPADDLAAILRETRRILREDGVLSSAVDMQDHYSYFDSSISAFNFLKFRPRAWALVNSSLHFQNRLRARDYRELHEAAGFRIVAAEQDGPREADVATVRGLDLAPEFRGAYTDEDLAVRAITLISVPA